jgi:hypothetical protein
MKLTGSGLEVRVMVTLPVAPAELSQSPDAVLSDVMRILYLNHPVQPLPPPVGCLAVRLNAVALLTAPVTLQVPQPEVSTLPEIAEFDCAKVQP